MRSTFEAGANILFPPLAEGRLDRFLGARIDDEGRRGFCHSNSPRWRVQKQSSDQRVRGCDRGRAKIVRVLWEYREREAALSGLLKLANAEYRYGHPLLWR